ADSTCTDWAPQAPIRLYMATADEQAANANSYHCLAALRSHGIGAPLVSVGDAGHLDSNRLGTAAVVRWFLRLSNPSAISASCRGCRYWGIRAPATTPMPSLVSPGQRAPITANTPTSSTPTPRPASQRRPGRSSLAGGP